MAQKGIRNVAQLHRALLEVNVDLSHPQLSRVIDNKTQGIALDLIGGLCQVLACAPGDLFTLEPPLIAAEKIKRQKCA